MTKGINICSGLFNNIKVTSNKSKTESIHISKHTNNKTRGGKVRGLRGQKRLSVSLAAWFQHWSSHGEREPAPESCSLFYTCVCTPMHERARTHVHTQLIKRIKNCTQNKSTWKYILIRDWSQNFFNCLSVQCLDDSTILKCTKR